MRRVPTPTLCDVHNCKPRCFCCSISWEGTASGPFADGKARAIDLGAWKTCFGGWGWLLQSQGASFQRQTKTLIYFFAWHSLKRSFRQEALPLNSLALFGLQGFAHKVGRQHLQSIIHGLSIILNTWVGRVVLHIPIMGANTPSALAHETDDRDRHRSLSRITSPRMRDKTSKLVATKIRTILCNSQPCLPPNQLGWKKSIEALGMNIFVLR